jgi:hypothetical protein
MQEKLLKELCGSIQIILSLSPATTCILYNSGIKLAYKFLVLGCISVTYQGKTTINRSIGVQASTMSKYMYDWSNFLSHKGTL